CRRGRAGDVGVPAVADLVSRADSEEVLRAGGEPGGGVTLHVGSDRGYLAPAGAISAALDLEAGLVAAVVRPGDVDARGRSRLRREIGGRRGSLLRCRSRGVGVGAVAGRVRGPDAEVV